MVSLSFALLLVKVRYLGIVLLLQSCWYLLLGFTLKDLLHVQNLYKKRLLCSRVVRVSAYGWVTMV
jgi:hypothetical protein